MRKKSNNALSFEVLDLDNGTAMTQTDEYSGTEPEIAEHKAKSKRILICAALIVACVYVLFLIYGLLSTEHYIDENSTRHTVVVNRQILKDRDDYNTFKKQIKELRDIMAEITVIDIKVANGDIAYSEASVQYQSILNKRVDKLIPKVKALDVQEKNALIKQELESIFSNDIAIYLQKISAAVVSGTATDVQDALQWRESIFQSYESIDSEIRVLADSIQKEDKVFLEWDINDAVIEKDETATLKQ